MSSVIVRFSGSSTMFVTIAALSGTRRSKSGEKSVNNSKKGIFCAIATTLSQYRFRSVRVF